MEGNRTSQWTTQLVLLALFLFALYSNVRIAVRNYHIGQAVSQLQSQVADETIRNQKTSLLLSYYQSASYQSVQARAQLGVKNPDETTIIVQGVTQPTTTLSDQLNQQIQEQAAARPKPESNFDRWLGFFFK